MKNFRSLKQYVNWMRRSPLNILMPILNGIHSYGRSNGVVLDRRGQYQTELFIVPTGVEIIEFHSHPNVDSFELHLSGQFELSSEEGTSPPVSKVVALGDKKLVAVPANLVHGGFGSTGASFLSFQFWKNGVPPSSVTRDFVLDVNNKNHKLGLVGRDTE